MSAKPSGSDTQPGASAPTAHELERLQRALNDARLDLRRAQNAKDELLAKLGHELRNPLSPMLLAVQLMRMQSEDTFVRERSVLERQLAHLVHLVDELLDVSRISRGAITLRRTRVALDAIVASAVEATHPLFEERSHALQCNVPSGIVLNADAERLAQVVAQLLANAAKYTPPRGAVVVTAWAHDGHAELVVEDSGVGISEELLPHVFDLFEQEEPVWHRSRGGLGLGLSIARNLTELHGGKLHAHSDGLGQGSRFTLVLDAAPFLTAQPA